MTYFQEETPLTVVLVNECFANKHHQMQNVRNNSFGSKSVPLSDENR